MLIKLKKIKKTTVKNIFNFLNHKYKTKIYSYFFKQKALNKNANHTWQQIAKKHNYTKSFNHFLNQLKQNNFIKKITNSTEFQKYLLSNQQNGNHILRQTNNYCKNCFDILGNKFCLENIDWQKGFDYQNTFYQDIKINSEKSESFEKFYPDIKIPWELSRFQHIDKKTSYNQINDWIDKNPFLLGVNWVCPMDVAIRAINFIYQFYSLDTIFCQKLICSLYDHTNFIENNWENWYKHNNHYLSDLIGYFYLCFFFKDLKGFDKKLKKTYKKILKEFDLQISDDGTLYEGSTSYHKLVTEIFLHFYLLCKTNNIYLPKNFTLKFNKMFQFLTDCTDGNGNFVQIGDNDSGKILGKILQKATKSNSFANYPNFGLTIIKHTPQLKNHIDAQNPAKLRQRRIKEKNWHITFRHPTFNEKQPTGHFHQDELSITLSIYGIPILVDSGSYVYTSNSMWRNLMRSYQQHNTFYQEQENLENVDLPVSRSFPNIITNKNTQVSVGLFGLPKTAQKNTETIKQNNESIEITNFFKNRFRKMTFDKNIKTLKITDWTKKPENYIWNFIFHPQIKLIKKENNTFLIMHKNKNIAQLKSTLNFEITKGFYSQEYGKIEKCPKLIAQKKSTDLNITFISEIKPSHKNSTCMQHF